MYSLGFGTISISEVLVTSFKKMLTQLLRQLMIVLHFDSQGGEAFPVTLTYYHPSLIQTY